MNLPKLAMLLLLLTIFMISRTPASELPPSFTQGARILFLRNVVQPSPTIY